MTRIRGIVLRTGKAPGSTARHPAQARTPPKVCRIVPTAGIAAPSFEKRSHRAWLTARLQGRVAMAPQGQRCRIRLRTERPGGCRMTCLSHTARAREAGGVQRLVRRFGHLP